MRLIDADVVYKGFNNAYSMTYDMADAELWYEMVRVVESAPIIDPVKHGHWCKDYSCSVCGKQPTITSFSASGGVLVYLSKFAYCPHCGAKLEEEQ